MDLAFGRRNVAGPLLLLNLVMYIAMLGLAGWGLDKLIDGRQHDPSAGLGGNGATVHFLLFAALAGAVGAASKLAGAYHARAWTAQGVTAAASLATVAWATTALAFGLACKEMHVGGERGWRLRALEGLAVMLAFTQLLPVLLLHAVVAGNRCGPGCPADDQPAVRNCNVM